VDETAHSNRFHSVSATFDDPMPGTSVSRFKTFDHYGNLQLPFQRCGDTDDEDAAPVDIDEAQGFEHIVQVLPTTVEGPTTIHEILLQQ
jgi:hypothetical protein